MATTRGLRRPLVGDQALEQQKHRTNAEVEAFLEEAQDVADSGGMWGFFSAAGRSAAPPPAAPADVQPAQANELPPPPPPPPPRGSCSCGDRRQMGEQCLDVFGGDDAESRYPGPARPKRPPGTGNGNGVGSQPELWPYDGSQASTGSMGPAPRPLQKLKARGATPLRAICGGPLGLYLLSALSFALLWQVWPVPTVLTVLGLILALHLTLPQPMNTKGRLGDGDLVPFGACACAAALGVLTGIYAHEAYASPYYVVALGREYQNVLASSASAAYEDAGKLHFANSSGLDYTRVLGYQNQRRYCVAPVVDSGAAQTTRIGFWAVGMDCCDFRGNFRCGDAGANAGSVKSGSRAPRDGIFERRRTNFIHAIEQAAAVYNLQVDTDPVLVNWVANPAGAQGASLACAFGVVASGAGLFVLLSVAALMVTSATV